MGLLAFFQLVSSQNTLHVLLVMPKILENDTTTNRVHWKKLLEDANKRVAIVNERLNGSKIELRPLEDESCLYPFYGESVLPYFVNETLYLNDNHEIIGSVGFFCPRSAQLIAGLLERDYMGKFKFPFFFATPLMELYRIEHPNLFHAISSLEVLGQALISFLDYQGWSRLSVVTGTERNMHSQTAEQIATYMSTRSAIDIAKYTQVDHTLNFTSGSFDARVVLVVNGEMETMELLCDAHRHGLRWPHNAWIVLSASSGTASFYNSSCPSREIDEPEIDLNGVFVVHHAKPESHKTAELAQCNTGISYLTDLICDSINIALMMHLNCKSNCSLTPTEVIEDISYASYQAGDLNYNKTTQTLFSPGVDISQITAGKGSQIGHYNTTLFIFESGIRDNLIPSGQKYQSPSVFLALVYFSDTIFGFVFVTTTFVLFVIYRREPEVKASSFSVTFVSYVSSFFLIFYLLIIALNEVIIYPSTLRNAVCITRSWLNVISMQGPLITATTIVKIFRVYRIFHPSKLTRGGRCLSDQILLLFILLLQVPNVIINLVWTITDPYLATVSETPHTNFIEIRIKCYSKHIRTWTLLLLSYNILLCIILISVAIKTRKIRKKNFKDTKKVNAFIFVYLYIVSLSLGLFLLGHAIGNPKLSETVIHVGSTTMILLVSFFLFIPKLYPPLKRSLIRKRLISNLQSKVSTSLHSIASQYTSYTNLPRQ